MCSEAPHRDVHHSAAYGPQIFFLLHSKKGPTPERLGRVLSMHVATPDSIPGLCEVPTALPGAISEHHLAWSPKLLKMGDLLCRAAPSVGFLLFGQTMSSPPFPVGVCSPSTPCGCVGDTGHSSSGKGVHVADVLKPGLPPPHPQTFAVQLLAQHLDFCVSHSK